MITHTIWKKCIKYASTSNCFYIHTCWNNLILFVIDNGCRYINPCIVNACQCIITTVVTLDHRLLKQANLPWPHNHSLRRLSEIDVLSGPDWPGLTRPSVMELKICSKVACDSVYLTNPYRRKLLAAKAAGHTQRQVSLSQFILTVTLLKSILSWFFLETQVDKSQQQTQPNHLVPKSNEFHLYNCLELETIQHL